MGVKETLAVVNRMEAEGLFGRYAIGGAVGALFYIEPTDTADLDIFIAFDQGPDTLVSLAPLYDWLKKAGYAHHAKEGVLIGDWPVQFLPASDALDAEALAEAVGTDVDGVPTRVMTAEHLVAIALRTGRGKDHIRILAFLESGRVDEAKLDQVLRRFGLVEKWAHFKDKYVKESG